VRRAAARSTSAGLEEWLDSSEACTLGTLNDAFGEKLMAAACLALMAPSALPIPTGGATHVLDVIALLFAAQMAVGRRKAWLPHRFEHRVLGAHLLKALRLLLRFVKVCERISTPRLRGAVTSRVGGAILGIFILVFVIGAAVSPPFTGLDTLPALGVVFVSLSILLEDALFALVGALVGGGGLVLAIFAANFVKDLLP
jgi:hypothetical protein